MRHSNRSTISANHCEASARVSRRARLSASLCLRLRALDAKHVGRGFRVTRREFNLAIDSFPPNRDRPDTQGGALGCAFVLHRAPGAGCGGVGSWSIPRSPWRARSTTTTATRLPVSKSTGFLFSMSTRRPSVNCTTLMIFVRGMTSVLAFPRNTSRRSVTTKVPESSTPVTSCFTAWELPPPDRI